MGALRTILAVTLLLLSPAAARAADDDWPVIKSARVGDLPPWGAFAVYPSLGRATIGVSLYMIRPADGGPPVMTARRVLVKPGTPTRTDWASAAACPALPTAMAGLGDLPAPRIRVPEVKRPTEEIVVVADGSSYFLWAAPAAYSGGAPAELEVRTVDGTPVADWIDRTLAAVAPCWGPK